MEQKFDEQLDSEQEQARFNSLAYQVKHGQMTREEAFESFQEAHKKSAEAWERYMNPAPKKTTYTAPEQQELLNIIKQLRDYIANSDIEPEDSDRLYQEHLALADSALSHCAECGECTHGRKIRSLWNNTLCEECGDDTDDEEEDDDEECGFCFGCEKPFYDILQKTGTLNCSCESPCTRISDGKISDAFMAWTNFKTLGN